MENSRRSANWRRVLPLWGGGLLCLVCAAAAQAKVTADPATGSVAVQTTRGEARFEAGTLVYLHNRLRGQTLIDATLDPEQPAGCRTALYVSDAPKAEPYWIYPAAGGDLRPAVTVKEADGDGVAVTFTGLVADPPGKARRHFPQAELTLTVRVEAQSGDLLVHVQHGGRDDHRHPALYRAIRL